MYVQHLLETRTTATKSQVVCLSSGYSVYDQVYVWGIYASRWLAMLVDVRFNVRASCLEHLPDSDPVMATCESFPLTLPVSSVYAGTVCMVIWRSTGVSIGCTGSVSCVDDTDVYSNTPLPRTLNAVQTPNVARSARMVALVLASTAGQSLAAPSVMGAW